MTTPPYTINATWIDRVATVAGWCTDRGFQCILNAHWDSWLDTDDVVAFAAALPRYAAIWSQVATAFEAAPPNLLFESFNEPHIINTPQLNAVLAAFYAAVRPLHPTRRLILGWLNYMGPSWIQEGNGSNWDAMAIPGGSVGVPDPNLAVETHSYDPWDVCGHPTRPWGSKPSDATNMDAMFATLANWSSAHGGIPVFMGESGCARSAERASRLAWYKAFYARVRNTTAFAGGLVWDDDGGFCIYNRSTRQFDEGVLAAIGLGQAAPAAVADADELTVDLTAAAPFPSSPPGGIPPDFASFSLEVPTAPRYLKLADGVTPRASFVALMRLLRDAAGGTGAGPNIRVGGASSDSSAYVPLPAPLPPNVTYRVTAADFGAYAGAIPLFGGSLTAGLNLRADDAALAAAHAAALGAALAAAGVPALLESCEVGNEVDLFGQQGYRPSNWSAAAYERDFGAFSAALAAAGLAAGRIQGAVYESVGFFGGLDGYTATFARALRGLSLHEYALGHCGAPTNITAAMLLNASAARDSKHLALMVPHVAAARALGLPVVIGEGNSASCGGVRGVSDAFAAALWGLDTMLAHAAVGLSRWNFHGGSSGTGTAGIAPYSPIGYASFDGDAPVVRPLFYALWAFAAATRGRAAVLDARVAASPPRVGEYVVAWALAAPGPGGARVVVVHKLGNATAPCAVSVVPRARLMGPATLVRLVAAAGGVGALDGVSFGGLTFDGSEGGVPRGTPVSEQVAPDASGVFAFSLAPASAAVLTLPDA